MSASMRVCAWPEYRSGDVRIASLAMVWRCPFDVRFPSDSDRNVAPRPREPMGHQGERPSEAEAARTPPSTYDPCGPLRSEPSRSG